MNLSKKIVDRYSKNVDLDIDWLDYRKNMLEACQIVIDSYSFKEEATKLMESYNDDIEQDKLYLAELEYYINDDKYSVAAYEYEERIKEYDNKSKNLFDKERKMQLEKEYQKRREELQNKAEAREKRRLERNIS